MERYLKKQVLNDLSEKMVFVAGPRQAGKTTLAKSCLKSELGYLNWDIDEDRESILSKKLPASDIWVFDEIHKFRRWRNYLKGLFDKLGQRQKILVTGSARLDLYRFGGDSLQGRYHFLRLHPLSVAELKLNSQKDLRDLYDLGPFPEPFFKGSKEAANRWSLTYRSRVIREEIPSLEKVQDIDVLDLLIRSLPARVGSPLSINSLREDLSVSFKAVSRWLEIFEKLYLVFRLKPFGSPLIKAVKKEQKHFHFDWNLVDEPGPRFENMIASHLLKWVHAENDIRGRDLELRFCRDEVGREVDFVICEKLKPILFVEAKYADRSIAPSLKYFKSKFPQVRALQVVMDCPKPFKSEEGIELMSALAFLKTLA